MLATRKEKSSASQPLRPPCRLFSLSHTGDFFTHPPLGNASREAPLRIPAPATAPGTNTAPAARRACLPIGIPGGFFHTLGSGWHEGVGHRHSGIFRVADLGPGTMPRGKYPESPAPAGSHALISRTPTPGGMLHANLGLPRPPPRNFQPWSSSRRNSRPGPNAYGSATQVRPLSLLVCPSAHTH